MQGDCLAVPAVLFPRVRQFLLEIDGKGVATDKARDCEGRPVGEAEVRFKLGEPPEAGLPQQTGW
jgi:hypothetical protein